MDRFNRPSQTVLPKNFLRSCLLLLLGERPGHGYDLIERLGPLGFSSGGDHGRLYRTLRALEEDGLVASVWSPSHGGPHRRVYELTDHGDRILHDQVCELSQTHDILGSFLCRCAEMDGVQRHDGPLPH